MRQISLKFNPSNGRSVRNLQSVLGFLLDRSIDVDKAKGQLGPKTAAAVAEALNGDVVDRFRLNEKDIKALNERLVEKRAKDRTHVSALHKDIDLINRKGRVQVLIEREEVQGQFIGPTTQKFIATFQRKYKLPSTGTLDPATEEKLISVATSIRGSKPQPKAQLKSRQSENLRAVVNFLRLNMQGNRVRDLQTGLAWLGHKIEAAENKDGRFGKTTRNAVAAFQAQAKLPVTGTVDGNTQRALNLKLGTDSKTVAAVQPSRVRGSVRDDLWNGISRARVRVRSLGNGQLLGERQTFRDGFFDIIYNPADANSAAGCHLVVELLDNNGQVSRTRTIYNAKRVAWANFTEGDERYGGLSEFERVRAALDPALLALDPAMLGLNPTSTAPTLKVRVLEESERRTDFTYLSRATGLPPDILLKYALAHRVADVMGNGISSEVVFGFLRQDLPPDVPGDLFPDSPDEWDDWIEVIVPRIATGIGLLDAETHGETLDRSIRDNVVPRFVKVQRDQMITRLGDAQVDLALNEPLLLGDGTVGQIAEMAGFAGAQLRSVGQAFARAGGFSDDFWAGLGDDGLDDGEARRLHRIVDVSVIARNHQPMVMALAQRTDSGDDDPTLVRNLAKMDHTEWRELIESEGIAPPEFADAADDDQRIDMYADSLRSQAERLFPDVSMLAAISRIDNVPDHIGQVMEFVDANPTLDLANANLAKANEDADNFLTEEGLATARALQRVRRLTPKAQVAAAMVDTRLLSAMDIVRGGEDFVADKLSAVGVGTEDIKALVLNAETRHAQVVAKFAQFAFDFFKGSPTVLPNFIYTADEIEEFKKDIPDLETLFGTLDYCDCPVATSLYSPAAYLTDLFRFLGTKRAVQAGDTVLDVLRDRRPDLVNIKLNEANTFTPVPYIDLINEVLEHAVPPATPAFNLQTTRATEELAAAPEHVRESAYNFLRTRTFPMYAGFNLWRAETRAFLAHLGAPRHEVMRILAVRPGAANQAPTNTQIAAESFGISRQELAILAPAASEATALLQSDYWGFSANQTEVTVGAFLRKTNLTYYQLLELLDTGFANPGPAPQRVVIERPFDDCDIDRQNLIRLTLAKFDLMHRFLRLWRRGPWQMWELDLLLRHGAVGGGNIDDDAIAALGVFRRIQTRLSLSVEETLAFFGPLNSETRLTPDADRKVIDPHYDRVFRNALVVNPVPAAFNRPIANQPLANIRANLPPVLEIRDDDYPALAALTNGQISDASLATLYRWTRLAKIYRTSIEEALILRGLIGQAAVFASPAALEGYLDHWDTVRQSGTSVHELNYLIRAAGDSHLGLRDEVVAQAIDQVRNRLARISDDFAGEGETRREILERQLGRRTSLENQDDLVQALDLIDGTWTGTDPERLAFIATHFTPFAGGAGVAAQLTAEAFNDGDALTPAEETAIEDRRRFVLRLLFEETARNTIAQWAGDRIAIDSAVARTLLETLTLADARAIMAHYLDGALIARTAGGDFQTPTDVASFPALFGALHRLHKIAMMLRPHQLSAADTAWLLANASVVSMLDPADLPVGANPPGSLFPAWRAFAEIMAFRAAFPAPEGVTLFDVLDRAGEAGATITDVEGLLAQLTQWPAEDLAAVGTGLTLVHAANPANGRDYRVPATYSRLRRIFTLLRRVGAPVPVMFTLAGWESQANEQSVAAQAREAAKSKYDPVAWLDKLKPIEDGLREQKRDALADFLIENSQRTQPQTVNVDGSAVANIRHWRKRADLTRYFLIDVEMSSCQPSSRIRQAISSTQLFVQRCFLNRENQFVRIPQSDPDLANNWEQWRWRRSYRLWEANRKVLFYPENWIEPELRDDKSPFFKELESDVQQSDLTAETAEQAYRNYLEKLRDVANLEVVGVYQELPSPYSRLHVIGRTRNEPYTHYYRYFDFDYDYWSAWERIDADIKGAHAIPTIYNRRLYIFWLEIEEKPEKLHRNPPAQPSNNTTRNPEPGRVLEIRLAWTERKTDGWTARKVSPHPMVHPWARPHFSYHLRPRYKPADNTLWIDLYVSTSREFNDQTFLQQGKPQYEFSHRTKTRFFQGFRPWHSSSFVFDGAVKQMKLRGLFAHYFLPKNEATRYVSSYEYVNEHFGEDGRRIESLIFPEKQAHLNQPVGMHYAYNRLANNDTHRINTRKLNVLSRVLDSPTLLHAAKNPFEVVAPMQYTSRPSMIYQDRARSFFVKAEWRTIYVDYQTRRRRSIYTFYPFYHPYTDLFMRELNRSGLSGLLNRKIQTKPETYFPRNNFNFSTYGPASPHRAAPSAQTDVVDFTFSGAYALYNWELFFHIPFYIAIQLGRNQRFEEAIDWFHTIFDPTSTEDLPVPQRYWITKPFHEHSSFDYRRQRIEYLVQNVDEFREVITAWANNPFKPHLVARHRPVAYQRAVVMRYLDTLIGWGDQLFRRETMEAINEAALLYMLAGEIMGDPPVRVPSLSRQDRSFAELETESQIDPLGNAEVLAGIDNVVGVTGTFLPPGASPPSLGDIILPYFCLPPNERLFGYWETVGERLFNIRHCRSITGVERVLDLFAPPIDPALLVKAAAAGVDLQSVLNQLSAPGPNYRFVVMIRLARETCGEVQRLGDKLLSALEKKDAEELAQLRARNEITLRVIQRETLDLRIDDAKADIEALRISIGIAQERETFYGDREHLNGMEIAAMALGWGSIVFDAAIAAGYIMAGGLALIPDFIVGGSGFGGSPHVVSNIFSGDKVSTAAEHAVNTLAAIAKTLDKTAAQLRIHAEYKRRGEDWNHQAALATIEKAEIQQRIVQSEIRLALAERERTNLEKQIETAETEEAYLTEKFTNTELYNWMVSQLSTVYFQSYQLAYDIAVQAESAYRYELGVSDASFVSFGHWDSLKKGLLAGDRLMHDLSRLETAFHERHAREYEITKHISLLRFSPMSLLQLRFTGECNIELPEWLFDMDYPGHYFRRLKTVSVTIPSVSGPYTSVNCTLSLVSSRIRVSEQVGGAYPMQMGDTRFTTELGTVRAIATSQGQDDSGLFRLDFNDPRFLPFEGAGALSTWQLRMPPENNQFDFNTITDVILHVRYTARDGGLNLQLAAQQNVEAVLPTTGILMISTRHEYADAWHRFLRPGAGDENELELDIPRDRFPFFVRDRAIRANAIDVVVLGNHGGAYTARVEAPGEGVGTDVNIPQDPTLGDVHHGIRNLPGTPQGDGTWRIAIRRDVAADFTALPDDDVNDVVVVMAFELA